MKNLAVHTHSIQDFDDLDNHDLRELLNSEVLCCTNSNNDDLYVLKGKTVYEISSKNDRKISKVDIVLDDETECEAVGIEYCTDVGQIWCAYASGAIVGVSTEPELHQELTNYIQGGLRCIKLSPDQEILVLITASDTVVTTVSNFHIISQADLNAAEYGKNQFITVGWGKKETQFHGSEGKAAAKAKTVIVGKTDEDDGLPRISWRGDGTMFAVSFLAKESQARLFKVFNREGLLQCTSELTNGLEPHISWKPSGNIIATSQLFPNKHVIAFFEKNGLKHRELCLPFKPKEIDVLNIQWSCDSEVFSIWCKDASNENTSLQLWTENNYHWYLKQTIKFTKKNPLVYFTWSAAPRAGKRLILLTREKLMIYSFRWTVDHSRGFSQSDKAVVGVIDGTRALLTGFRVGIVPPPMAHQSLEMNEIINSIVFSPSFARGDSWLDSNVFMCLLAGNRLALCVHSKDAKLLEYEHVRTYEIEWETPHVISGVETYSLHHFLWYKENVILCSASAGMHSYLCVLDLEGEDFRKEGRIVIRETCPIDSHIEHIVSSPDENVAYILADKCVFKFTTGEGLFPTDLQIPESCSRVEVLEIDERHIVVSLTSRGRLFIDGNETASNITSFTVHSEFLLLTTMQHALICVPLDAEGFRQINQDLTVKPWENGGPDKNVLGLSVRRVERGSNLIIAIPKDSRTILQMPRGNLECIQPRALSLRIIGTFLDELNYSAAFDSIRKQRINLNLIYDHNPVAFIENAPKFVQDIENPAWLSLFLSELQDENVMSTIYNNCYRDSQIFANPEMAFLRERKVERVCELLRNVMESRKDANRLIQPILTSLVKNQQIPGLEAALRKVKEIRSIEGSASSEYKIGSSDEALRYLLYLVDVNVMFDIAMGMYDLELALFVASKSQKDPKEYIPLINDLKEREENYMKYSIDKRLKRYDSALNHMVRSQGKPGTWNSEAECLEFIVDHNMYGKALKLFPNDSDEYREVARLYGEVLMRSKKYYEAAIMFMRSLDLESALRAYKAAGSWQDVIVVAKQSRLGKRDMQELYEQLVGSLEQDKRYKEAAEILVTYLKQHEEAVSVLCEGKEWTDAMRIAHSMSRHDLIETHVKPGVLEHSTFLLFKMTRNREEFEKHKTRLATVRQENAARELRMQEALGADYDYQTGREVSDLLSETSSVGGSVSSRSSRSSRSSSGRTYRSSKNRRKQERNVFSIKEGSMFEDLALIRALHLLITLVYADKDEVKVVTHMLLLFDHDEMAEKLQNSFGELLSLIERGKNEIWPNLVPIDPLDARDDVSFKDHQPNNIPQSLLEPRFMYPPESGNTVWQLNLFNSSIKTTST